MSCCRFSTFDSKGSHPAQFPYDPVHDESIPAPAVPNSTDFEALYNSYHASGSGGSSLCHCQYLHILTCGRCIRDRSPMCRSATPLLFSRPLPLRRVRPPSPNLPPHAPAPPTYLKRPSTLLKTGSRSSNLRNITTGTNAN